MSAQPRTLVGIIAIVAMMAGLWFLLLAPKRADIGATAEQIAQAESRRDAALASAAQAKQAKSRYHSDYATVARLGKAVPADDDIASLVFQLESIARANKIDFRAVKLTGAAAAAPAPDTAAAGAENNEEPGADAGAGPAASTAVAAPVVAQPPPGAVVGSAGLLTVPFTLTFNGDYMKLQRLLKAINGLARKDQQKITVQGRLLTVDGFSLAAAPSGFPKLRATVSATAYIVSEPQSTTAAAAPQDAAGTSRTAMVTPNAQGAGR